MKENKQPIIYEKGTKNTHWGRTISSKDGAEITGFSYAKEESWARISYYLQKLTQNK